MGAGGGGFQPPELPSLSTSLLLHLMLLSFFHLFLLRRGVMPLVFLIINFGHISSTSFSHKTASTNLVGYLRLFQIIVCTYCIVPSGHKHFNAYFIFDNFLTQ